MDITDKAAIHQALDDSVREAMALDSAERVRKQTNILPCRSIVLAVIINHKSYIISARHKP